MTDDSSCSPDPITPDIPIQMTAGCDTPASDEMEPSVGDNRHSVHSMNHSRCSVSQLHHVRDNVLSDANNQVCKVTPTAALRSHSSQPPPPPNIYRCSFYFLSPGWLFLCDSLTFTAVWSRLRYCGWPWRPYKNLTVFSYTITIHGSFL